MRNANKSLWKALFHNGEGSEIVIQNLYAEPDDHQN